MILPKDYESNVKARAFLQYLCSYENQPILKNWTTPPSNGNNNHSTSPKHKYSPEYLTFCTNLHKELSNEERQDRRMIIKALCQKDITFWFNLYAWTFDPRVNEPHIPFITYEFQDEFIKKAWDAIKKGEDLLTEKSRDMGATWLMLGIFIYGWLFHGMQFKVGSRKEESVDRIGDMDSLFERMRYIILKQPKWLLPYGFDRNKHLSHMKIINPEKGNQILGEATTKSFSRSGRYKAIMLDEFAFVEDAEIIWQAAGDSTPCRLPISTPCGIMNHFAQLRNSGRIEVQTLHWSKHPLKTKQWYEKEKKRRSELEIAQELEIDYLASAGQCVFDRQTLNDMIRNCKKPIEEDRGFKKYREFDPTSNYVIGVDTSEGLGNGDNSAVIFLNCKFYSVDAVYLGKPDISLFAFMIKNWAKAYNDALVVVEDNNHGMAVLNDLKKIYHRLYHRKIFDEHSNTWTKKIGWRTTIRTKPIMIEEVKNALKAMLYIPSKEVIGELMTYNYDQNNKMGAQAGCYDDTVMALACALQGYLEVQGSNVIEEVKQLPRYCASRMMLKENEEFKRHELFFA